MGSSLLSGGDTLLYPVPDKNSQDELCLPSGDVKIRINLN